MGQIFKYRVLPCFSYIKMAKITTTIWKIDPHTEAKHAILRKYLDAWLPILTKHIPKVVFIDGFAGPGEYIDGKDGSPIIAIRSVIDHKINIESKVIFLFVERDPDRCEFLNEKLKKMKFPKNIIYECECGAFAEVVGTILDDLAKRGAKLAPTFVFIDPFGFRGVNFDVIKKIMKNDKCEVLINFMFEDINRFIDLPQNEKAYNEFFGTDGWKKVREKKDSKERLKILHGLYKKQLEKIAKYVISFKMVNKFNKIDYFLFFTTNHRLGLEKMKESMWRVDPGGSFQFSDATYDPNQTMLFEKEPNFSLLKRNILKEYKGKRVSIGDLEDFVVVKTPFLKTHYKTRILKPMEKESKIKVIYNDKRRLGTYPEGALVEFL